MLSLRPANLLKKRNRQKCFPVNLEKFVRTPFFTDDLPRKVPASARPPPESFRNLFGRFHEF